LTGKALDRAVGNYRDTLRIALRLDPPQAEFLCRGYDRRIPNDRYALAFGVGDEDWLTSQTSRDDHYVLAVVFQLATRLRLHPLQRRTRDRLADVLGSEGNANLLITHLRSWQDLQLLETDTITRAIRSHLGCSSLERDAQLWTSFFTQLPRTLLPDLFEVRYFLGLGADAVRLADSPAQERKALDCCLRSALLADAEAGLELARRREEPAEVRRHAEHTGDLLYASEQYGAALDAYREAARLDLVSDCYERLGRFFDALATCPADQPDRLAELAHLCRPDVDALVERQELVEAAHRVQGLVSDLDRAAPVTETVTSSRDQVMSLRENVLRAARLHFGALVDADQQAAYETWSRFEEAAGELGIAARRAEQGGEFYRASRLFREADQFGEAARVLEGDTTPDGLRARAEAYEAGGDLLGAARLHQQLEQPDQAIPLFVQAEDFAAAARCLVNWKDDKAVEDARLADYLRRAGDQEKLARLCLAAIELRGHDSRAVYELRRLRDDALVPPHLMAEVRGVLAALGVPEPHQFEEHAQEWVQQARAEIDRRYAKIWGFDLGTTTCTAAIYDTATGRPVLCPWQGELHFASTLCVDRDGNELVGLSGEELLAPHLVGKITEAKRKMGTRTVYKIRDRSYRPEEAAARLIRHARGLVERFLATQVRERVGELARAKLGEVQDDWLEWAERSHDLMLARPKAVVTIPAYFTNNQKHATRTACEIAGVSVARLIHEPTAACIATVKERRLTGRIAVVDLGAGTLDVSLLDVDDDNVYDVLNVAGDNHYGGKELDVAVTGFLAKRLARQGIQVPTAGRGRTRLEVAAERLKIAPAPRGAVL